MFKNLFYFTEKIYLFWQASLREPCAVGKTACWATTQVCVCVCVCVPACVCMYVCASK